MIKKICDKCGKEDSNVCTYTIADKCLNIKQDYLGIVWNDGVVKYEPKVREYCQNCYEELSVKINSFVRETLSL